MSVELIVRPDGQWSHASAAAVFHAGYTKARLESPRAGCATVRMACGTPIRCLPRSRVQINCQKRASATSASAAASARDTALAGSSVIFNNARDHERLNGLGASLPCEFRGASSADEEREERETAVDAEGECIESASIMNQ